MRTSLLLSLVLLTGISLADTTQNQLDADIEDGFLNSTYDYPNIHTHKQLGYDDNTIFTGSSYYDNEASQTVNTSVIGALDQLDAINYGVDYYSYYDGTITLKADFYDDAGLFLDNDGGTYVITSGSWQSLTNTYSDSEYLDDIFTITITIGGESDYGTWGTDAIQLRDAYVTYDYSEIPLVEILEDTTLDELIMDLIEGGADIEFIEEVVSEVLVDDEEAEELEIEDDETNETEEVGNEEEAGEDATESDDADDGEPGDSEDEPNDKEESSESSDSGSSNDGNSVNTNTGSGISISSDGALELLELVSLVDEKAMIGLTDTIDFSAYTSASMQDAVELQDNDDWYENQEFYGGQSMPDSGILNSYKYTDMKDNKEWY